MSGRIIPRAEWQARQRKGTPSRLYTDLATVHWEGPKMGVFPHTKCAAKVRSIQDFHMDTRDWSDIAYSAVVCPHGDVFAGRGPGVRTGANGTNTGNDSAYAVCALVGEGDPITDALLDGITAAVGWLGCTRTNAHRDWKPTACPGDVLAGHAHAGRFLHTIPQPAPPKGWLDMLSDKEQTELLTKVREIHGETVTSTPQTKSRKGSMRWLVGKIAKGEEVS